MVKQLGNDERAKANPEAKDLKNPEEAWADGAVVPSPTSGEPESGPLGRVADAGTLGAGATSPYGTEIQAEIIAGQSIRRENPTKRTNSTPAGRSRHRIPSVK